MFLLIASVARSDEPAGVTFFVTSDCHYTATRNVERNDRNRATIDRMNVLPGTAWPEALGGRPIDRPRGVLVLGDILDDGDKAGETKTQRSHFIAQFGLDGTDGRLHYPVFEGWGNHDGPPGPLVKHGFSVQARLKARTAERARRGWLGRVSENGLHYSWDWDDIHFVHTNLYPADRQNPGVKRYDPRWHDPQDALRFLKDDLRASVGDSGRSVVVVAHCGFDTDWWIDEDWRAFYNAVRPYHLIAYFYGHTGTGVRTWKPPDADRPLDVINTGQTEKGFFVVEITPRSMRLGYQIKTPATGDSDSPNWEWKHLLKRSLRPALQPAAN